MIFLAAATPLLIAVFTGTAAPHALSLLPIGAALAYVAARGIASPLGELAAVSRRLVGGDLKARPAAPLTGAWIDVSHGLSTLAERLDTLTRHFDEQVGARTAALNRKADQLRALGQVGQQVAAVLAPEELLPYVVKLMRGTFGYDLVAVVQDNGSELVLTACAARGSGDPIPRRALSPGDPGVASIVAGMKGEGSLSAQPSRLIDAIDAKEELVAPIRLGQRALGALVVQSLEAGAFDDDDLFTVRTIAGQVAVALENARLLQAERSLREFAVAEERNRLAREIHDTLAQAFLGILMHLRAIPGAPDAAAAEVHREQAALLAQEGLQEARRSVWNLRPRSLEEKSLATALADELKRFQLRHGIATQLDVYGDTGLAQGLPPRLEAGLLRIAQEALHNVAKHAHATSVTVELRLAPSWVELTVHDDGVGFEMPAGGFPAAPAGGFGLGGMRERAHLLGGELSVVSSPGAGTRVTARVPRDDVERRDASDAPPGRDGNRGLLGNGGISDATA